jgi:hypothetical protein
MVRALECWLCVLGSSACALARQASFEFEVDYGPGRVALSEQNPTCRVRVFARFSLNDYAFAAARFDVTASEEGWSNNALIPPINASPGVNPGAINGAAVTGIIAGQVHFPPGLPAITNNPMALWEAEFTTSVFTVRQVSLRTLTTRFDVYPSSTSPSSQSRIAGFTESRAQILVVPPPGALVALALVSVAHRCRRIMVGH